MRVGIHQLHYLPWLRYFEKIARADVFVVLDDVQFNKNGWQNRNKIKTAAGAVVLTVPVHVRLGQGLDEVAVDNSKKWSKKHWRTIEQSYRKAPYFRDYAEALASIYDAEWDSLNALNRRMLELFLQMLGIATVIRYSSDLAVPGTGTERLVNLVHSVDGTEYYSGAHALTEYLDPEQFENADIGLSLQNWEAPSYPQLHGPFAPDLAIIDLLMNCGPRSLPVLTGELG